MNKEEELYTKKRLFKYTILGFFSYIIGFFQYLFSFNKSFEKEKFETIKNIEKEINIIKEDSLSIKNRNNFIEIKNNINEKKEILNKIKESKQNIIIKNKVNRDLDVLYNILVDMENIKNTWNETNKNSIDEILDMVSKEFQKVNPFIKKMEAINDEIEVIKKRFVDYEIKLRTLPISDELKQEKKNIRTEIDGLKQKLEEINNSKDINKIRNDFEILRLDNNKFLTGEILEEFEMIYLHQEGLLGQKVLDEKKLRELKLKALEEERKRKQEEKKKKEQQRMLIFREKNKEDLFLIEDYIKKDLDKVNKEIKKLNKLLSLERKKSSTSIFRNFFNSTLRFGVTLLPLKLFKNKLLGNLLSMVLLNNKIRAMRNIVKKQKIKYLDVEALVDNIKKNSDITNKNITIYDDSLYQLVNLKEEFLNEYKDYLSLTEVEQTLNKIEVLENTLVKQKEKLTLTKTELSKAKVKVKQM